MSARKQRRPLRPLPRLAGAPSQDEVNAMNARMFAYMKLALSQPDPPECDRDTAAMMAGCILGQRVRVLMDVHGLSQEAATAAGLAWVEEQAAHWARLAAAEMNLWRNIRPARRA